MRIANSEKKLDFASLIPEYVAETRDILVIKRVRILTEKWGTLKRVAGALVYKKFTTPKRWIAIDLVHVMNVFLDFFRRTKFC